ncbi:MarR family winged helix-turn-helix transcriptional regulator [Zafaria sp. J156]|uniref:MarR family winged helix-turn-helix transcriptional regulator n=1 Tax=Zafaria sp. J156 TaxID=3116490 RepID=UPI002E76D577|nr:MarR family transcriptional regulator [Zafaria sp. J156]MEE1621290.1 MarR family transcriptional regulator [Zafaria sp. J156]
MTVEEERVDDLALERQLCFALSVASRNVVAAYRPVLDPLGLTHPQYLVMLALWGESPLTLRELGERLQLDPGTLSPLLKRLEASGYVERKRRPEDGRALAVVPTAAGIALRRDAERVPVEMMRRLGMSVEELASLHRLMNRLAEAARRTL